MNYIEDFFNKVRVIDTETTGIDSDTSEVIEISSGKLVDNEWQTKEILLKPLRPIPPEASAIHYISNRMVADQAIFDEVLDEIGDVLDLDSVEIMVAHNSEFDRQMIQASYTRCYKMDEFKPFNEKRNWICTWRLAKAVLGIDYERVQYGLGFLRYYLDLNVSDDLVAHRAAADVTTCGRLLEKLLEIAIEKNLIDSNSEISMQLIKLCWDPLKITKWTIGKKYAGRDLSDIPTDYYMWAIANIDELNEKNSRYNSDLAGSIENILVNRGVI